MSHALLNGSLVDDRRVSLLVMAPPYGEPTRVSPDAPDPLPLPFGSLLGVSWTGGSTPELSQLLRRLRARYPMAPLFVEVESTLDLARLAGVCHCAARSFVRAIVPVSDRRLDELRLQVCQPADFSGDLVEALRRHRALPDPRLGVMIRAIAEGPLTRGAISRVTNRTGLSIRTLRRVCSDAGLPSPSQWVQLVRAMRAALHIQGRPRQSLARSALELNLYDESALAHLFRIVPLRPSQVRQLLGWDWILHAWVTRAVRSGRKAGARLA